MAHIDFKNRSITAKVVYYGPGLCGKTTNLEYINSHSKHATELMAVSTEGDRTIFFDFLPINLGKIRGIDTKFKLYAVPGQVRYNMTRKLVLKDTDGVVFVADSQRPMLQANLDSLQNLFENLGEQGIDTSAIPLVIQYNKRDLDDIMGIAELQKKINKADYPFFAGSALKGDGVFETLDHISRLVFDRLYCSMGAPSEAGTIEPVAATSQPSTEPVAVSTLENGPMAEAVAAEVLEFAVGSEPAAQALAPASGGTPTIGSRAGVVAIATKMGSLVEELTHQIRLMQAECSACKPCAEPAVEAQGQIPDEEMQALRREAEVSGAAVKEATANREKAERRVLELETAIGENDKAREAAQARTRELESELQSVREALEHEKSAAREARAALEEAARKSVDNAAAPPKVEEEPEAPPAPKPAEVPEAAAAPKLAEAPAPPKVVEPSAPPAPSASVPITKPADENKDPFVNNKEHQNASRIARVMVADIFLYHRDLVLQGIREGNVHALLEEQLRDARKTFQARVAERVWKERDYLSMEFERLIRERSKELSAG